MNGLMTKYKESLLKTPKPIPFSAIKGAMDYRGLLAYAKSPGKKISQKKRRLQQEAAFLVNKPMPL